jgi:signal transduction histidine kinase/AraC-like DNA-binding protein
MFNSKRHLLLIIFLSGFFYFSCNKEIKEKHYTIGFSQCVASDKWRQAMLEGMKRELAFHDNIQFIYKDADGNSRKQIEQVKELIDQKINLLIISPNEANPLTPIVKEVYDNGTPVIVIDRKISSASYTAYLGADNYQIGYMAGDYAASLLNRKGNIIEISGLPGSSPAMERTNGFADAINKYPSLKIINEISGDWVKPKAYEGLLKLSEELKSTDLIFAQNDVMAVGTFEALKSLNQDEPKKIIGIDALSGPDAGIDFIENHQITASLLYPTGGEEAIQLALKILKRENFKKENILPTLVVDSTNVRLMKLQTDKINSQQKEIEKQQNILSEQIRIYKNQRTFNNILITALFLVVVLGLIVYFSWRKNKRISKKLQLQNEEISKQSNQLIELSAKTEEAHQARINFFTNISHEFRTPLTLILAPLEELLSNPRIHQEVKQSLQLIQRNGVRLYRLIDQLMDFRKIEFNKMPMQVSENDIIGFTKYIVDAYKLLAKNKNIDLQLITSERKLDVWFDVRMLDKVIFNLMSNAFKFTKEDGFVHVTIMKEKDHALIKIEDDGIGMTKEVIEHAFDPFFQGEYENYKGTGLGLALSKELIELHRGSITVKSEKRKGSVFVISLMLGNAHFKQYELATSVNRNLTISEDVGIYTIDLFDKQNHYKDDSGTLSKDHTLLIIEDNQEMREYLTSRFSIEYNVSGAENGNMGLQIGFDIIPDLIICDIVIPGKNGLELTKIFKKDIRTSHIPVILLTARDQQNQKIEGFESQADAYITKPFNLVFLQKTVKSLLENREKIKGHYSGEIFSEAKSQLSKKTDRKFIIDFTGVVENNIGNEKFGVNDICKELGISRIQLYRKIKIILNCNVNDYIITTRLQKAKYYMQHENLTISEIAFKSGFSSAAYFSTVFKSKFGLTPKEFKQKL